MITNWNYPSYSKSETPSRPRQTNATKTNRYLGQQQYQYRRREQWRTEAGEDNAAKSDGVGPSVYVAGFAGEAYNNRSAVVWKDGVPQRLGTSNGGSAYSVFVSGSNVYVLGKEMDWIDNHLANQRLVVWKNGSLFQTLLPQTVGSGNLVVSVFGSSLFVSDNDVYIAATIDIYPAYPRLWKNGIQQSLGGDQNKHGYADSVFVNDGDVYVAGSSEDRPTLWGNGTPHRLSASADYASAEAVFVSGSDVYVMGNGFSNDGRFGVLWKNNVPQYIEDTGDLKSIFVSGSDVYLFGHRGTLWKNNVPQRLDIGSSFLEAASIYVSGDDVWVAGEALGRETAHLSNAFLFKNGVAQPLDTTGLGNFHGAYSVFVK